MSAKEEALPRLARGVRLKFDPARKAWVVLAPERVVMPDETALEILRRCDGQTSLAKIIDSLAVEYDAPREAIAADVQALLDELTKNGILQT